VSIFKRLQEKINVQPVVSQPAATLLPRHDIKHEFRDFSSSYRIGILCYYTDYDSQEIINNYKKELERLGYECEVLLYIDSNQRDANIYLQSFSWDDLDKRNMLPHSPRTDRFMVKRYDMLFNLYLNTCPQLEFVSMSSQAKCRVGLFTDELKNCSDILIPMDGLPSIEKLIQKINELLKLKPYERKPI
jgi:hypothetical protein